MELRLTPKNALLAPVIHMNGTSRESLREENHKAARAVSEAIDVLCQNGPNARDYYVYSDPAAFGIARAQHEARVQKLSAVRDELLEIGEVLWE